MSTETVSVIENGAMGRQMEINKIKALFRAVDFLKVGTGIWVAAYLIPFNRQRELGYITTLKGTAEEIIEKARTLARNIEAALPGQLITIHIEEREGLQTICQIGSEKIFDKDGNELTSIESFLAQEFRRGVEFV